MLSDFREPPGGDRDYLHTMLLRRLMYIIALPSLIPFAACERSIEPADLDEVSCEEVVTVLDGLSAESGLGFTGAEVLGVAAGVHTAPIFWHPGDVTFGPETGEGELSVDVTYAGGEIRYVQSTSPYAAEMGCVDRLEIDAAVELRTAGGALDESFTAALRASRLDAVMLRHEIDLEAVEGELEVLSVKPDDGEAAPLSLELGFSTFGIFGSFDGGVEVSSGDAVAFGLQNYATFPTDGLACDFPAEAPVPFDAAWGGVSAEEALALLDTEAPLELQWDEDAPTSLTIEAGLAGTTACGRIDPDPSSSPLRFDVAVTMKSEDGRLDGALSLRAAVSVDDGGELSELTIQRDAPYGDYAALEDFSQRFGVHGVDLSGYDGGGISFDLTCDGEGHHGAITVLGAKVHECSEEVGEGCQGTDMVEVVGGVWASAE